MRDTLGKPEIIRYDADIAQEHKDAQKRASELQAEIRWITREISQVQLNLGAMEFERCDVSEYIERLNELRSQLESKELGVHHAKSQVERLERIHIWLKG